MGEPISIGDNILQDGVQVAGGDDSVQVAGDGAEPIWVGGEGNIVTDGVLVAGGDDAVQVAEGHEPIWAGNEGNIVTFDHNIQIRSGDAEEGGEEAGD